MLPLLICLATVALWKWTWSFSRDGRVLRRNSAAMLAPCCEKLMKSHKQHVCAEQQWACTATLVALECLSIHDVCGKQHGLRAEQMASPACSAVGHDESITDLVEANVVCHLWVEHNRGQNELYFF